MAKKPVSQDKTIEPVLMSMLEDLSHVQKQPKVDLRLQEAGSIRYLGAGVATVEGLPHLQSEELLRFADGSYGIAFDLLEDLVGVIMLEESPALSTGIDARRTSRVIDTPVGESLLGRVINPLGRVLDGEGPLFTGERRAIEKIAPSIMQREPVTVPLQTGLKVIDSLIPIGKGQRQLILGDRQTGKTAIALDTIINQKDKDVICIYCAIGQRNAAVASLIADLKKNQASAYTVVVVAGSEEPPGLQYIAPYAATSMAEYFMEQGRDVLIVYDDLTKHARSYREISLLLRRPPGREAYPGDIFYIHSRLLERATNLKKEFGGGSLTALPVVETEAQNISAYIPTNLISITDGQIYLSPSLFQQGVLPAVDVGRSVSRVGGKTQTPSYRSVTGDLRLSYSQFKELESFSRFGTRLDEETKSILDRGHRVQEVFRQSQYQPMSMAEQIGVLLAVSAGKFDELEISEIAAAEEKIRERILENPALAAKLESNQELTDRRREKILHEVFQANGRLHDGDD